MTARRPQPVKLKGPRQPSLLDRAFTVAFFGLLLYLAYLAFDGRLLETLEAASQWVGDLIF